jgi:tetratricopeptide (TPR) repeat protein
MIAPLLVVAALLAAPTTPRELNSAGMELYKLKKLKEAAGLFTQAIAAEPKAPPVTIKEQTDLTRTLALAHYNLACVLALLRARGQVCEAEAYRSNVLSHLQEAVRRDPARLDRALKDPDLASVRDTLGYQSLQGLHPSRAADLPALLPRVRFWSQGVGAYGSIHQLELAADGSAVLTTRSFDDAGKVKVKAEKGRWKLTGRSLSVNAGSTALEGPVAEDGSLEFKVGRFTDAPSECDA